MTLFGNVKKQIDQKYRLPKFAKVILSGVKSEMLASISFVEAHLELQNKELNEEKGIWNERLARVDALYKKLNSYGYKNRKDYFDSAEDDPDLELIDIIGDINRAAITPEAQEDYSNTLNTYYEEIRASEKVLSALKKMSPIVSSLRASSIEDIEKAFSENECSYLLNMPNIISFERILNDHYG